MLDDIKIGLGAADKPRANSDVVHYRYLVIDLIFQNYVSDTFAARGVEVILPAPA